MRRSALIEVGGFDASLVAGEEPELCRRLRERGYRIEHIDAPMTGHDLNMTGFKQYWLRAVRAGHAYAEVSSRYRKTGDQMWLQESNANLRRGSFWIGWFAIALAMVAWKNLWIIPWLMVLPLCALRSAWRNRSRAQGQPLLLMFYGLHSHIQQIPIMVGQLRYFLSRRSDEQREQIEYKRGTKV